MPRGRPRLRGRLPIPACLLPASPRPQQRSSDAPPSVPVAPRSTRSSCASLKFLLLWIGLRERLPVNPVLSAAQGKASAVGSAPPTRPLFPCDPRISAASDPSRAGANLWLSRFEERKGRRVTSEPHSRRFLRWGALGGGAFLPPLASPPHFRLSLRTGEKRGPRTASGTHPPPRGTRVAPPCSYPGATEKVPAPLSPSFVLQRPPPIPRPGVQVPRPARPSPSPPRAPGTHRHFLEARSARVSPGRVPGGGGAPVTPGPRRGLVDSAACPPNPFPPASPPSPGTTSAAPFPATV